MSEWKAQREAFFKIAIAYGLSKPSQLDKAFPLGYSVPDAQMTRWLSRITAPPKDFSSQRRYINRFMLGADPEFVLASVRRGLDENGEVSMGLQRKDASTLGMHQGPAFGADNNGRLAEIRPHPSRSALDVCASILDTLRWMVTATPQTLGYSWLCGAWQFDDGLGGHVHFGRKRPNRAREIAALDQLDAVLNALALFPQDEVRRRRLGDRHGNHPYGLPGDFRFQRHGYEYRTWPSWLDSPALAFLVLTLSKLVVHDPGLVPKGGYGVDLMQQLWNFMSYYRDLDDDARLALYVLKRGLPRHSGGDFKVRWGITPDSKPSFKLGVLPLSIKPCPESRAEMFTHLLTGKALEFRVPKPTWSPLVAPAGYYMLLPNTRTVGRKGVGELIWDLCAATKFPIELVSEDYGHNEPVLVSTPLLASIPASHRYRKHLRAYDMSGNRIAVAPRWCEGDRGRFVRQVLLSGVLPLWEVGQVRVESIEQWIANVQHAPKIERKYTGRVLFANPSTIPGVQ